MSWEHQEFVESVLLSLGAEIHTLTEKNALHYPRKSIGPAGKPLYQGTQGTGMGMMHSGCLSDLAFWRKVEVGLPLIRMVSVSTADRDDVLVISSLRRVPKASSRRPRREQLDVGSLCWRTRAYTASSCSTFLKKRPRLKYSKHLDHSPFIEPTARHVPLHLCGLALRGRVQNV